ncbi:MAG: hypothetical protein COB02_03430 [Candidatus Cloacimonadota bacterium]|nr:MAG: hypothetical protein COB02_03430 [Candidatus Cloacimonadota bacterium]
MAATKNKIMWFLFYALCILRNPDLFLFPRFWAEEGSIYFQTAYNEGFFNGLSQVQMGYFSIIPNISTSLASLFPLKSAPYICLIIALLIQSINISLVLNNKHYFWKSTFNKSILFFSLIFLPFSEEVFLNTICSQFHLQISVFLLIYFYQEKISKTHLFIYLLAFLSGGVGIITFIIFSIFIKKENLKNFRMVFYILLICFCLQGFFYFISYTPRLYSFQIKYYFQIIFVKHIIGPFFGYALEDLYHGIIFIKHILIQKKLLVFSQILKIDYLKVLLLISGVTLFISTVKSVSKNSKLLLSSLILSIIFIFLSLKNGSESFLFFHGGGRYFYASNFIFYLAFFEILLQTNHISKIIKQLILLWFLTIGVYSYFKYPKILVPEVPLQKQTHKRIIQLAPKNFVLQINLEP